MSVEAASQGERCGRCGADASSSDGLVCPACGALLAAYRNPASVRVRDATPPDRSSAGTAPITSGAIPAVESPPPEHPPATQLLPVAQEPPSVGPATEQRPEQQETAPQTFAPAEKDVARRDSLPRAPHATPVNRPPLPERRIERLEPRPRRPGFVTVGTIEPIILYGSVALAIGCVFVGIASVLNSSGIAAIGFVLVIIGVLAVVVAVLVALVRRESERR